MWSFFSYKYSDSWMYWGSFPLMITYYIYCCLICWNKAEELNLWDVTVAKRLNLLVSRKPFILKFLNKSNSKMFKNNYRLGTPLKIHNIESISPDQHHNQFNYFCIVCCNFLSPSSLLLFLWLMSSDLINLYLLILLFCM